MATLGVQPKCPTGFGGIYPNCVQLDKPSLTPTPTTKPTGAKGGLVVKKPPVATSAGTAGGGTAGNFTLPSMPAGAQASWSPSSVQRPDLTPINPQAAYDPEMARTLASQRSYAQDLKAGTGFAADVMTQQTRDTLESELQQAKAASIAQGIPFDEAAFRARGLQSINKAQAGVTLGREAQLGEAIKTEGGQAAGQAGERTSRMDLDLRRDVSENELALDRYGKDIQKYSADAAAATAANNALMDFYSRLAGGIFSSVGSAASIGGNNYSFG
jgi:hypothetical protein